MFIVYMFFQLEKARARVGDRMQVQLEKIAVLRTPKAVLLVM